MSASNSPIGILTFPGSNCDADCIRVFKKHFHISLQKIHAQSSDISSCQGIIIPGGFSFGDYLRAGRLAVMSPVVNSLRNFVKKGGAVLGICNGFQILTEAKLLPGALITNSNAKFICQSIELEVNSGKSLYQKNLLEQQIRLPIAHMQGRYVASKETMSSLKDNEQIVLTYKNKNPNGSLENIAAICSNSGKVMGMMPHPERACCPELNRGNAGIKIFEAFLSLAT
jgi:phosphoribosylformylglycinamidine synthase subunit PurQ / glutaminase